MARLVELTAKGPRRLDADDIDSEKGDIAVCQCGLSETFPLCDGSHRVTEDEKQTTCYRYPDGDSDSRQIVTEVVVEPE